MNDTLQTLEDALASITAAKCAILGIDPDPSVRRDLDEAYQAMSAAQRAILSLITPVEVGGPA